jgi:hypothetical protein
MSNKWLDRDLRYIYEAITEYSQSSSHFDPNIQKIVIIGAGRALIEKWNRTHLRSAWINVRTERTKWNRLYAELNCT